MHLFGKVNWWNLGSVGFIGGNGIEPTFSLIVTAVYLRMCHKTETEEIV